MDMLWVKTLKPWCRGKQTITDHLLQTFTYSPWAILRHHWSLGSFDCEILWMLQPRDPHGSPGSPARIRKGDPQEIDLEARLSMFPRKPLKRFILHLRGAAEPLGDYEMERWKHDWFILIHAISMQHVHQATNLRSIHRKCFNRDVQSQLPSLPHIIFLREASHEPAMTIEIHEVCCNLHQHVAPFMDREASK